MSNAALAVVQFDERAWAQETANKYFQALGRSSTLVAVNIVESETVLAQAAGITLVNLPIGTIQLNRGLFRILDRSQIEFVIAHEVAHIHYSDAVASVAFGFLRSLVEAEARKGDRDATMLLLMWGALQLFIAFDGGLPPSASVTKDNELRADATAARLTGNLGAAVSALLTLANGKLDAASHTWELFKTPMPIMTVGERITWLRAAFGR